MNNTYKEPVFNIVITECADIIRTSSPYGFGDTNGFVETGGSEGGGGFGGIGDTGINI